MEKRRSLDDLMCVVKSGRALSLEAVGRIVEQFFDTPVGSLYPGKQRKEWLPNLLTLSRTANRCMDYTHFVLEDILKYSEKNLHSVDLLFNLGMIGYMDPVSRLRVDDRLPDPSGECASESAGEPGSAETEDPSGDAILDELYRKNVIPFLHLSVRDYMEYLMRYNVAIPMLYQRYFARDVELWEKNNETTPTIGDVLAQAVQSLCCFADVRETVSDDEMKDSPLWDEIPERPFQRKNIQGTYWPPEDEEGILDAEWIWVLMCVGPLMVYRDKLKKKMAGSGK